MVGMRRGASRAGGEGSCMRPEPCCWSEFLESGTREGGKGKGRRAGRDRLGRHGGRPRRPGRGGGGGGGGGGGVEVMGLEVMENAVAGLGEEMGAVLVASAVSPNVRERRDSSAALFDARGEMIAQAAHIPVHLGAMPDAVAAVRALAPKPGDTFILNDPFTGGTHLPDITLVHAIELAGAVAGFTVVRAHHSDVGGMRPGSMPPHSTDIFQEGIVLPPVRWASAGV